MIIAVALTTIESAIFIGLVALLCRSKTPTKAPCVTVRHRGRHAAWQSWETRRMVLYADAWTHGREEDLKTGWIVEDWPVWSWNCE